VTRVGTVGHLVAGRPRVYLAHPIGTFGTPWAARCAAAVGKAWPQAELIEPATRWSSNEEWLAEWPAIVKALSALVVVGDEHGRIGIGCWSEIGDAILWRVPLFTLAERRGVLRVAAVARLDVVAEPTPWLVATVRARPLSRPPVLDGPGVSAAPSGR
jgi:hypothetical protein